MSDQDYNEEDEALAAEYVIGLLTTQERQDVRKRLNSDPGFAARIDGWAARLDGLNEDYGRIEAPARIKTAIDGRLFATSEPRRWPRMLLGMVSGLAAVLVALVFWTLSQPTEFDLQVALASTDYPYGFDVSVEQDASFVDVSLVAGDLPDARVFELWVIPDGGAPQSLGVFGTENRLPLAAGHGLTAGSVIAVSLEPTGGSPTGAPTGPVLAVGVLEDV